MDTQPPEGALYTADALFARPDCTHIVSMDNPGQNVQLERTSTGFRLAFGSSGEQHASYEYASLDEMYHAIAERFGRGPHPLDLRGAIWQDISDFPAFSFSVGYRSLENSLELRIIPNGENASAHGPHVVYGAASIATDNGIRYVVTPQSGWLVVEYPAYTFTGRGGMVRLRITRNIFERWRLHRENAWLRRNPQMRTMVRPSSTVVYGHPPAEWHANPQSIPAEPPQ